MVNVHSQYSDNALGITETGQVGDGAKLLTFVAQRRGNAL
jgi:hypothetical protein